MSDLYPIFNRMESRQAKEQQLGQRGLTLWFTGLSGSGKSTLAIALERRLSSAGYLCRILDGDNVRMGINRGLGFGAEDRRENIRRIAEVCRLFNDTGIVLLASFVSPTEELRSMAREIIGESDFVEIYVRASIEECERRDVKGLYAKARRGEIADFTGITAPYEPPQSPSMVVDTEGRSIEECVDEIFDRIKERVTL